MTNKLNEQQIIEMEEIRDELISHIDILDKVKKLLLLPSLEMATTKQVAEFYGVSVDVINMIVRNHKDEIESDGSRLYKRKEIREVLALKSFYYKKTNPVDYYKLDDDSIVSVSNMGVRLFPKRAILRVGMLLRDSEVAKEVRTQLLNIEEKAPDIVKTHDTDFQKEVAFEMLQAKFAGDWERFEKAEMKMLNHLNRHIEMMEHELEKQKPFVAKMQSLINSTATLTCTQIASSLVSKNGTRLNH